MPDVPHVLLDALSDKEFWRTTFQLTSEAWLVPVLLVWRMASGALGEVMRKGR
jgi:hypothetical protein